MGENTISRTEELTEVIREIDEKSHMQLCDIWRHAPSDNKYVSGLPGKYLKDRIFGHFGGFTPTISKSIGW